MTMLIELTDDTLATISGGEQLFTGHFVGSTSAAGSLIVSVGASCTNLGGTLELSVISEGDTTEVGYTCSRT